MTRQLLLAASESRWLRQRAPRLPGVRHAVSRFMPGLPSSRYEFALLYGIQPREQERLAREGQRVRVLISYGESWFPWYMRRLAERPANVWFALKSLRPW